MNCLSQFSIYCNTTTTFSIANGDFMTWTVGTTNSWCVISQANNLIFDVQGFKNIDLYGIKVLGEIQGKVSGAKQGIVNDYKFRFLISGQPAAISGQITSNNYGASLTTNTLSLGKHQNEIMFADPIKSCKQIEINVFSAEGINNRSLLDITLDLNLTVYCYYKYEGEDLLY